nr:MAG TPA: hypothetical protein [Caudoviricetes sp.]
MVKKIVRYHSVAGAYVVYPNHNGGFTLLVRKLRCGGGKYAKIE